jgi:hypothetical protein
VFLGERNMENNHKCDFAEKVEEEPPMRSFSPLEYIRTFKGRLDLSKVTFQRLENLMGEHGPEWLVVCLTPSRVYIPSLIVTKSGNTIMYLDSTVNPPGRHRPATSQ